MTILALYLATFIAFSDISDSCQVVINICWILLNCKAYSYSAIYTSTDQMWYCGQENSWKSSVVDLNDFAAKLSDSR
jgi:hypothetical protein